MRNIVAFDVETTGTDSSKDVIIQLAAVKFDKDFNRLDSYCCYVKPMEDFEIAPGDRIAQIIVESYVKIDGFTVVEELSSTVRGSGGFGSTGSK